MRISLADVAAAPVVFSYDLVEKFGGEHGWHWGWRMLASCLIAGMLGMLVTAPWIVPEYPAWRIESAEYELRAEAAKPILAAEVFDEKYFTQVENLVTLAREHGRIAEAESLSIALAKMQGTIEAPPGQPATHPVVLEAAKTVLAVQVAERTKAARGHISGHPGFLSIIAALVGVVYMLIAVIATGRLKEE